MVAFGHTAVGVIIGISAYQVLGSGGLLTGLVMTGTAGVISHYLTDAIPHGHFQKEVRKNNILPIIFFDLFLSLLLFVCLTYYKAGLNLEFWYILFGIGGSQWPDVLDGFIHIKILPPVGIIKYEYNFHQWLHWHGKRETTLLLGFRDFWQVLVVISALLLVLLN